MQDQKKHFDEALAQTYVAAMFDVDGTLIETGGGGFPAELVETMAELSMTVPLAICSGRRLEGMIEMMEPFFAAAPDRAKAQENWTFFLENGSMGLAWNSETQRYEKFYQVDWPAEHISMVEVHEKAAAILPAVFSKVVLRMNECNLGIYVPDRHLYLKQELGKITASLAEATRKLLMEFEQHELVHVIDSGVAAHIIPAEGDKDRGIQEFARILREEHGLVIGPEAREILIIGDQPGAGFNDEKLLEGKWGTPFTAEHINPGHIYPIPVFNEKEEILKGPEATLSLLRRAKF